MSNHATLPHLPKGMAIPKIQVTEQPRMPGQKELPPADWKNSDHAGNKQLIRTNDGNRRNKPLSKQGVPWSERQPKNQNDLASNPPMFSATPKKVRALRHPIDAKAQHQVYRLDTGINPVNLLVGRLEAWESAIKDIVSMFKKVYIVEGKTAKGLISASRDISIPFKGDGQFLEGGGIQEVWSSMRDYIMQRGILHHESGDYIRRAVIPSFKAIKTDVKNMIMSIVKDKSLRSDSIFQSRVEVDRMIARLDNTIEFFHRDPLQASQNTDPFLMNLAVIYSIRDLCDNENQLHDNILSLQRETGIFESKVIENSRYIIKKLQEFRMKNKIDSRDYIGRVIETFESISPASEWNEFIRRNHYNLVSEASAYKTEDMVEYPNKDSHLVRAIKVGPLEYKSGVLRNWTEGINILTPVGFLHGYKSPKHFQLNPLSPSYSIFLPQATVINGDNDDGSFEIRGKDKKSNLGMGARYMFRASSAYEGEEWFNYISSMTDQFKSVPLLSDSPSGYGVTVPRSRDLPPLPDSVLPLPGNQAYAAIENSHSHLDPVQEYEEEEYYEDGDDNQYHGQAGPSSSQYQQNDRLLSNNNKDSFNHHQSDNNNKSFNHHQSDNNNESFNPQQDTMGSHQQHQSQENASHVNNDDPYRDPVDDFENDGRPTHTTQSDNGYADKHVDEQTNPLANNDNNMAYSTPLRRNFEEQERNVSS
ncbi:hypothetical protein BDB01DRAFT_831879 [Pilobolus umbonatus]|nr:hypothetical protein BDB01DRAFT_831879 [Pilobolus umbonatus]